MSSIDRRLIYGRVVPALAILLGLSYGFLDSEVVSRTLLFALVAVSALGWLAPRSDRAERRDRSDRRERRARRSGALGAQPQDVLPGEQAQR